MPLFAELAAKPDVKYVAGRDNLGRVRALRESLDFHCASRWGHPEQHPRRPVDAAGRGLLELQRAKLCGAMRLEAFTHVGRYGGTEQVWKEPGMTAYMGCIGLALGAFLFCRFVGTIARGAPSCDSLLLAKGLSTTCFLH